MMDLYVLFALCRDSRLGARRDLLFSVLCPTKQVFGFAQGHGFWKMLKSRERWRLQA